MEASDLLMPPAAAMDAPTSAPTVEELKVRITQTVGALVAWVLSCQTLTFFAFETQLVPQVLTVGRLCLQLFLYMREAQWRATATQSQPGYKRQGPIVRQLGTFFGKVSYARTYFYRTGGGYYPLDIELGVTGDGFSLLLTSCAVRLATKVSYAQTVLLLTLFLHWAPAQTSLAELVLGLGRHTAAWFAQAPAPSGDGDVLVIQLDSKATPTATAAELAKRRGPRAANAHRGSARHRGRVARLRRGGKKRRQKGDKAKNGKMATIVVMYTLRKSADGTLEGPLNKKVYASYAPKRHAVTIARREADKRGFTPHSGKAIQLVTDGDNDLERYIAELFPTAEHTIDIYHVVEYLWEAGACLYREGSPELTAWVELQEAALYDGRVAEVIAELTKQLAALQGSARARLTSILDYFTKRQTKMDYKRLRELDWEIGSGAVEGAVRYVIAQRFDCGGMRWVKERAEALLQLRCIEVNNDWEAFITFMHDRTQTQAQEQHKNLPIKCAEPAPLPTYGLT